MTIWYSPVNFLKILLLSFFLIGYSLAQGSGMLRGTVYDEATKEGLPGANLTIKGTSLGAATDIDGKFVIRGIPAGKQTIVVSYIGYEPETVTLNISSGATLERDFGLSFTTLEGEEVVITAQAQGQLEAINQQLSSDNIANIVSETKIQELPDFNAASALSRLPGISTTQSSGEDNKVVIRGLSPKYNSIEVDGVTLSATGSANMGLTSDENVFTPGVSNDRSVDLTMISPYMIRTISVYKSLTPDMNANSIGGTVNMELREAPPGWHTDLLWQSGYTAKSNAYGNYRAVASGSNRFLNNKLGVYALLNIESYDRNADNLDANYDISGDASEIDPVTGYRPVEVGSVTFNRHLETRKRYGGNLILDYNLPNGSIKFSNLLARINSDYTDHRQTINYNNGRMEWRLQQGENVTDQQMHSIKLDYDLGFLSADLSASYTSAANKLEDSPVLNFNQVGGVFIQDRRNLVPEELSYLHTFRVVNEVVFSSGNLFSNYYQEKKYTYKADFEVPYNIGKAVSGFFKLGGQYNNQSNSTDQEAPYTAFDGSALPTSPQSIVNDMMRGLQNQFGIVYNPANGQFIGNSFLNSDNDIFDPFLDDTYGDIYFASNPALLVDMMNFILSNPAYDASDTELSNGRQGGWYDGPYQRLTNDYTFDENYYATYAMTKINFLDFMVIGGARYEKVKSDYFAYNAQDIRNVQLQQMYDTTSVNENEFVLPMGQIKYSPFEWMDIRYAYTHTLSRPDYQSLSPKFTININGGIYAGNPELKAAKAINHDVNLTFHNNEIGLLTVGGFYKTIENFVYSAEYRLDAAQEAGIDHINRYTVIRDGVRVISPTGSGTVYRPLNNPFDATVKGLELDFQHSFWYLPMPFNNIVFGVNYARIYSESKYTFYDIELIPGSRPPRFALVDSSFSWRLIYQPNHVLNSYIGYDYKGVSGRLSVLFQDNSARFNGLVYSERDSYTKEYFRIDFSARQKLPWFNSELFLDVTNLNDRNTSWIQKSTEGYQGIQNYGLTANLGIRVRY